MSLNCEICKTPYTLHDGVYICEEGHIFQHTLEVFDEFIGFTGKSKSTQKEKKKKKNTKKISKDIHQTL